LNKLIKGSFHATGLFYVYLLVTVIF
jgi:hypothetical protein